MLPRQPLPPTTRKRRIPARWLMCDARLDDAIPAILAAMPPRSGVIVRPYAMRAHGREKLIRAIRRVTRAKRHVVLVAGRGSDAGFDGRHGLVRPELPVHGLLSIPVHDRRELARAKRLRADAVLISPVWPTRSHPGADSLSQRGFARLAATAPGRVIALGGMTERRFSSLRIHNAAGWAAIDAWQAVAVKRRYDVAQKRNWVPT